jgi:hypothetical protein
VGRKVQDRTAVVRWSLYGNAGGGRVHEMALLGESCTEMFDGVLEEYTNRTTTLKIVREENENSHDSIHSLRL